jgi:hypothetical protein
MGDGAILAAAPCVTFTPEQAGANPSGDNATTAEYALEPAAAAKGAIVVQLNGSLGSPAGQIADPTKNIYNAAAGAGFHVLGLAYRSTAIVGVLCKDNAPCFGATRKTLILGVRQPGAPLSLASIRVDEGIVARIDAALRLLAATRPTAGWGQFIADPTAADASQRVAWSKVIASGHSQGGGHAAYLGQLFPLREVVQLSSTCDAVLAAPAPWTAAGETWGTSPALHFVGFAAPTTFDAGGNAIAGDTACPYHAAVWANMGLDPSRRHDDAATCGASGNTHSASVGCADNFERWGALYE